MAQIWVIADQAERAFELLAKARELASSDDSVICFMAGDEAAGNEAISFGADKGGADAHSGRRSLGILRPGPWLKRPRPRPPSWCWSPAPGGVKDLGAQLAGLMDAPLGLRLQALAA